MSDSEEAIHPETLEEKAPEFIVPYYQMLLYTVTSYGWHILGASLIGLYLWNRFQPSINKWRSQYDQCKFAAECKKNPDLLQARQEAIEKARRLMQEEHDKQAVVHAEKMKAIEEKRREERLQRAVGSEGHRLDGGTGTASGAATGAGAGTGTTPQPGSSKKSSNFKPEYNPLMGAGGSGGYRPPKRGCPGGGCGKKK